MPTTDRDDEIIASMPPGTRVRHVLHPDVGTVIDGGDEPGYGQILVQFDNGVRRWCYPINLEHDKQREGQ